MYIFYFIPTRDLNTTKSRRIDLVTVAIWEDLDKRIRTKYYNMQPALLLYREGNG